MGVEPLEADAEVEEEFIPEIDFESYFPEDATFGTENLKLQVKADVVKALEDGQVWQIPFAFRSSVWHGNPWDHPSVLYVPSEIAAGRQGMLAVIQQGTDDLDPGINQDSEFGMQTAIAMGIPVVVLAKTPHPTLFSSVESDFLSKAYSECFESFLVENFLAECARKLTWLDGKESMVWALEIPMVKTFTRAITAVEEIPALLLDLELEGVPAFTVERVILGAAGKRARALWLAGRQDERVVGLWLAGGDWANLPEYYTNMAAVWSSGYTSVGPNAALEFLDTEFGTTWEYLMDPYRYMDDLEGVTLYLTRGTNDPVSPLGSYARYEDKLPPHQLLLVPNTGFGMGTDEHVTSWRALIAQIGEGTSVNQVVLQVTRDGDSVDAVVLTPAGADGAPDKVKVWRVKGQATNDDLDLRDAVWEELGMDYEGELSDGKHRFSLRVSDPSLSGWAFFAQVSFTDTSGTPQVLSTAPWLSWEN